MGINSCSKTGPFGRALAGAIGAFLIALPLAAQEGTVTGTVTDQSTMAPLSGVQVHIPGEGIGGFTGEDGSYSLGNVPAGEHTVRAELLGYAAAEETVTVGDGETVTVDLELAEQALALDELVVTGQAAGARQREVGSSVGRLRMEDVREPVGSVDQLLSGRQAGMTVTQTSGMSGGGSQIRLRGNVSVAMSNQPLIYIDGVRMRSDGLPTNHAVGEHTAFGSNEAPGPLNTINPEDIARIEVVRGPAATALYGTEAAAGVIQIFTHRGEDGVAQWTAQVDQGVNWMQEFGPETEPFMRMDPWLRNAHQQRYNVSVRGGGEALQYFMSGSVHDSEGVLPRDEDQRYILRTNFGFQPLPGVDVEWNTTMSRQEISNTSMGNNPFSIALNAYRMPAGRAGNYLGTDDPEVVTRLLDYDIFTDVERLTSGLTATHTLGESVTNRISVGIDRIDQEARNVRPFGFVAFPAGSISNQHWQNRTLTLDYTGTADFRISDALRSSFSWGGQWTDDEEISVSSRGEGLPGPGEHTVESAATRFGYEERFRVVTGGFFVQNLFDLHDRYFLTVALRMDGNSAFGEGLGLEAYPRANLAYVISDEDFWDESRFGEVRLRAAWGHAGRAPGAFDAVRTWQPWAWSGGTAFLPDNVGNPELGPERTEELEVGLEGAFFDRRLDVDFTYYTQTTSDALFNVQQIPTQGFTGSQLENAGEISNRGIELSLNLDLLRTPAFDWDAGLNISTNRSRVEDLGETTPFSSGGGWIEEGYSVPVIRNWGIRNPDEFAEPEIVRDSIFGPNQPTHTIQVSSALDFANGISLSARGEYQGGHYIFDGANSGGISRGGTSPFCDEIFEPLNVQGQRDQFTARERSWCDPSVQHANLVYPADFFRLRDVTLSMPVPFQIPGAAQGTVRLSLQNAWTWKNEDFLAMDPEMTGNWGMEAGLARSITEHIPAPASFMASFRVTF